MCELIFGGSMVIYLGDRLLSFSDEQLKEMEIGDGEEAISYRYESLVLKIYREQGLKWRLSEDDVRMFSSIPTRRILMPQEPIFNERREFCGYSKTYIKPLEKGALRRFREKPMSYVLAELSLLGDDSLRLAQNHVMTWDFTHFDNCLIGGDGDDAWGWYFLDPGSFEVRPELSVEEIYLNNISRIKEMFEHYPYSMLTQNNRDDVLSGESVRDWFQNAAPDEPIFQYVKRMSRPR